MNSSFCGEKEEDISTSSLSPVSSYSFCFLVLMVNTVPVSTLYLCSSTGFSSLLIIGFPSVSSFLVQFFRSTPIPPVTPTVVRKIGDIPFVPATIGAIFTNGTYGLA